MTHVEHSRTFPVALETAYDVVVPVPLEEVLGRRHLAIPGVAAVEQSRPWGQELGQRRVLRFSDGGRATEVLTVLEAPHRFGYGLTDLGGPMKLLVAAVDGLWSFETEGAGTRGHLVVGHPPDPRRARGDAGVRADVARDGRALLRRAQHAADALTTNFCPSSSGLPWQEYGVRLHR